MEQHVQNDNLVLISGASATGKSASLMGFEKPEGVMFLACEPKKLPFKADFFKNPSDGKPEIRIVDPLQVVEAIEYAETLPEIHTIVIDTATFLFDMYETQYVLTSSNTMASWGEFAQFIKKLFQYYVNKSTKNVIVLAHTRSDLNEQTMTMETKVPVKGSVANVGIESFFSTVISTKKIPVSKLQEYANPLLTITEEDEMVGFKYVYQTRLTKETVNERIRSPLGMWNREETYIDNNIQLVLNKLHNYYA